VARGDLSNTVVRCLGIGSQLALRHINLLVATVAREDLTM